MMNYHTTFKKKGQEIFLRCLTLLIYLKLSCRPVGTKENEDWELSTGS